MAKICIKIDNDAKGNLKNFFTVGDTAVY